MQVYKSNGGWTEGEAVAQMLLSRVRFELLLARGEQFREPKCRFRDLELSKDSMNIFREMLSSVLCQVNNLQSVFNRYDVKHSGLIASKERGT